MPETKKRQRRQLDNELAAMTAVVGALEPLSAGVRGRVLAWAAARFAASELVRELTTCAAAGCGEPAARGVWCKQHGAQEPEIKLPRMREDWARPFEAATSIVPIAAAGSNGDSGPIETTAASRRALGREVSVQAMREKAGE